MVSFLITGQNDLDDLKLMKAWTQIFLCNWNMPIRCICQLVEAFLYVHLIFILLPTAITKSIYFLTNVSEWRETMTIQSDYNMYREMSLLRKAGECLIIELT